MTSGKPTREGILFVLSAPSGTGKSTVAQRLVREVEGLEFSVSYTTRPRRAGEEDGRDYHFIERARFEAMAAAEEFLEWAGVFDHLYGTGRDATRTMLAAGRDLLLDIDVQGARQLRDRRVRAVSVMLLPPDFTTLESRLRSRGSESVEQLALRLAQARVEAEEARRFDYMVVNADLAETVEALTSIVGAERHAEIDRIVGTFPG
jgi:guanylate kinase